MKRLKSSIGREKAIKKGSLQLLKSLIKIERKLSIRIQTLIDSLDHEDDKLKNTKKNKGKASQLNKVYRDLIKKEGQSIVRPVASALGSITSANERYFNEVTNGSTEKETDRAKKNTFKAFGLSSSTGKIIAGSLLHAVLFDESPINKIKSLLLNSLRGSANVTQVKNRFDQITRGGVGARGLIVKHFFERIPEPFERFDRAQGQIISIDLKLDYAIYQGGIIRGSRPFCKIRNNRVFTREEISKFGTPQDKYGGYSNKSAGEFQGKNHIYNPFTDIGGHRCRHQFDWISEELAFVLRPDLRRAA